jgi:GntR family transcriptional regulator of vanillate catabolism
MLEGAAARLASERLRDVKDLAPLEVAAREMVTLVRKSRLTSEGFRQYIELNAKFHADLIALAHSRMLQRAIERACTLPFASPSAFLKRQTISPDLRELFIISADQHCQILEAIAGREGMRAEIVTREHSRVARRNLEDALRSRDIPADIAGARLVSI